MPTRVHAGTSSPADRGSLAAGRSLPRARAALAALASTAALGFAASPASAATPAWGYEQLSPADGSSSHVYGVQVSEDGSTVSAMAVSAPMGAMPADGRGTYYFYGLPRGGAPWMAGPLDVTNGAVTGGANVPRGMSVDGSRMLFEGAMPSVDGAPFGTYRVDAQGETANTGFGIPHNVLLGDRNLDTVAILKSSSPQWVYIGRPGQAPVQVSVDNSGNPMTAGYLGGSEGLAGNYTFLDGAYAPDGSSVIFTSTDGIPGDNDGGAPDVYRRILTPGHEETVLISDATDNGAPDPPARGTPPEETAYRWATADHSRVFFQTADPLEPGDTDGEPDLYLRDGKAAPVRVSQGETVDGSPTGNGSYPQINERSVDPEWVLSSEDGNRTFFVSQERLTQDAPATGAKLYERDVAEGRTRLVAGPLDSVDTSVGTQGEPEVGSLIGVVLTDLSFRGLRVTPDGAVFLSSAPLAGAADDGRRRVFVWTRDGGVKQINKPDADAPASSAGSATILPYSRVAGIGQYRAQKGGRGVSDDGSQVFFSTQQALTAQDTDGNFRDVYVWSQDEGVRLVSPPGRDRWDADYLESSPDGSEVFLNTRASILPSDGDPNAQDVYVAILGGGLPPSPQVPDADPQVCGGDACQGPITTVRPPSIGSVSFAGTGNVLTDPDPVTPSVTVSKVKAVTGSAATLKVRVPAAGRISVSGSSLRRAERSASKAGSYSVKVGLSARGKSALKKKRSLKVQVRVAYRSSDGPAAMTSVSVTFKQPAAKRTSAASKKGGR